MRENAETGALENFNFDLLLDEVPELKRFDYKISTFTFDPPIDSSDMGLEHWSRLVKIIDSNYRLFDGFVILHGTDTMAYTAEFGKTCYSYRFAVTHRKDKNRRQGKPDYCHRNSSSTA